MYDIIFFIQQPALLCLFLHFCFRHKLFEIAYESWGLGDDETRHRMSVMASAAAWGLGQWDSMEEYVKSIPQNTMEGAFFQSLMHIHHRQFNSAQKVGCMWWGGR